MYFSSGNYEAFARPRKPEGAERKRAWFVGSGLAALAGAAFLVRDGQVPGERITILERLKLAGGALDGIEVPEKGFVVRGGRELEDHMECLWDLFRSVPSLEIEGASVLDEFYWLKGEATSLHLYPDLGRHEKHFVYRTIPQATESRRIRASSCGPAAGSAAMAAAGRDGRHGVGIPPSR
ncbi:oleate hydratase [Kitasatospora sp. NPDC091257]|uniref:oleate hydratase n=1 Tax=Kitasatospora sp. NPDC091257 TaxID=3364084 RepID=UPI00381AF5A5